MSFEDFIRRCIELEVDGVSLETCFIPNFEETYLKKMKDVMDKGRLEPVVAWGHPDGLEGGKNRLALEEMKKHFRTCHLLDARIMRIVCSSLAFRNQPHLPQIKRLSKMLKEPAKMAEENGIRLAIENHFDFTSDEILEILNNVHSDCLGVTFDTGNALRIGEDPVEAAKKLSKHIFATHVKDVAPLYGGDPKEWYFFASVPLGKGIVDIPSIVRTLEDAGYEGLFAIEVDYLDPKYGDEDLAVAESVTYLKDLSRKVF
jgi:sugar phosphate isomerase/epimerase